MSKDEPIHSETRLPSVKDCLDNQKPRILWIDIAKAIGIYLVVLGHCYSSSDFWIRGFIYKFHMPLFFLLAGCTFNAKEAIIDAFRKCFFSLILPAVCWCIVYALFDTFRTRPNNFETWIISFAAKMVDMGPDFICGRDLPCGAVWFLFAMFYVRIVMLIFCKSRMKACLAVLWAIGFFPCSKYSPGFLGPAVVAFPFFAAGYLLFTHRDKLTSYFPNIKRARGNAVFIIVFSCCLLFSSQQWYGNTSIASRQFGQEVALHLNIVIMYFLAFIGSAMIIVVARLLERLSRPARILSFIGKNTLVIMCAHRLFMSRSLVLHLPTLGVIPDFAIRSVLSCIFLLACLVLGRCLQYWNLNWLTGKRN